MILAGVDEAGLGPTLGPLVTASAALAVPDDWRPDSPWRLLADAVGDRRRRNDPRPVVADSKAIYRDGGLAALELTVGAFALLAGGCVKPGLTVSEGGTGRLHSCYSLGLDPFPLRAEAEAIRSAADRVGEAAARAGAKVVHLEAAALFEPVLNRRFARGLNKNQALLEETGWHLARLAERFPDQPLLILVDKQGGRNDYLPFLSGIFPGLWPDVLEAGAQASRYHLRRGGGDIEIRFLAKADRDSFATALASETAKYIRERAMAELNDWFLGRLPGLAPTAGYPLDARRWLDEVRSRGDAGLQVELLVRSR